MADLLPALTDSITDALPVITGAFAALLGVTFVFAMIRFIRNRVKGEVK